jgi:hypothetical protein
LPDVGGLLEQEPAAHVEQVQRLASQNAKASLEEIRKRSEEEKAAWQREKKEMQQQVNRLQEEVLAAANAHPRWRRSACSKHKVRCLAAYRMVVPTTLQIWPPFSAFPATWTA